MSSILINAVDSIELGVEDFQSDNSKRLMSAVRNIYAGVLLLFKHKLAQLSGDDDEALIKQDVVPVIENGRVVWKGKGKKTVDFQSIRKRFESLGIGVDWKRLDEVQTYRNNIEHYHTDAKPDAVRQYISNCFLIVRNFIVIHLKADPRDLLGAATWDCLCKEQEVYEAEKKSCLARLEALEWPNNTARLWIKEASCTECNSDLIHPTSSVEIDAQDRDFQCSVCGKLWSYENMLVSAGSPHDSIQELRDAGEQIVGECPECGREGYDSIEEQCAFCGDTGPHECSRCCLDIPIEELSWVGGGLCGYCAHMCSKDD